MQSPLIKAAKHNAKLETRTNYIIAALCGAFIGAMLALAI